MKATRWMQNSHDEAEGHERAGDVGELPAGVADDLEDRGFIVVFEAGLIEGEARVAQRVVHVDETSRSSVPLGVLSRRRLEKFFGISVPA